MNHLIRLFFVSFLFTLHACVEQINDPPKDDNADDSVLVKAVGQSNTFEIMTWNIENFPLVGSKTINHVKTLIRNLDVDLIAVQEIGSISSFNTLLDSLPGWSGILSEDTYSSWYQKTGFLFKSDLISMTNVQNIFDGDNDWYAFPRPPLAVYVKIRDGSGIKFDFNLIVLHLKAFGDEESRLRRLAACEDLEEYMNDEIEAGADPDFIVLGDWNDNVNDPQNSNVFNVFLENQEQYRFLTKNLGGQFSYINSSLIDHILITTDTNTEFGQGTTRVLYLDEEFRPYPSEVSDHRPVVAVFEGITIE